MLYLGPRYKREQLSSVWAGSRREQAPVWREPDLPDADASQVGMPTGPRPRPMDMKRAKETPTWEEGVGSNGGNGTVVTGD